MEDLIGDDIIAIFEFYEPRIVESYSSGEYYGDATPQGFVFVADGNGVDVVMSLHDADRGALRVWARSAIPWGTPPDEASGERGNRPEDMAPLAPDFRSLLDAMEELPGSEVGRRNWEAGQNRADARVITL
nr:hypothetical protein [Jannaschia sp. LMIT008]